MHTFKNNYYRHTINTRKKLVKIKGLFGQNSGLAFCRIHFLSSLQMVGGEIVFVLNSPNCVTYGMNSSILKQENC